MQAPLPEIYPATIEALLHDPPAPASSIVNIEELDQLVSIPAKPRYHALFEFILQRKAQYPVPPPRPSNMEPPRPPSWTSQQRTFETPVFQPPYYPPRLSRLNRFVDAVHLSETKRVTLALASKAHLEAQLEQRNTQVEALARDALARWRTAKEQQAAAFLKIQEEYRHHAKAYAEALRDEQSFVRWQIEAAKAGILGLLCRVDLVVRTACQPPFLYREARTTLDDSTGVLLHECRFPRSASPDMGEKHSAQGQKRHEASDQEEKIQAAANSSLYCACGSPVRSPASTAKIY